MKRKKNKWNIIFAALLTTVLFSALFMSVYGGPSRHLQDRKELLSYKNATASKVLSAEGRLIGKFYLENRTNVSYNQIPPSLIDALIATEDARFFEHKGVDARSLFRVLFKTILTGNKRSGGGSTITQQLAKNMYGRQKTGVLAILRNKIREIILAYRIEKTYTKEEILTLYLNTVPFGEDIFGIEAAASRYFNKRVEQLKTEESAVLVGMLKATTFYNPGLHPENAKKRRSVVLGQMVKYNYLQPSEADSLRQLPLKLDYKNPESEGIADYFLVRVKRETTEILKNINSTTGKKWNPEVDGLIINTTLNLLLQTYATRSFREHLPVMQKRLSEEYQTASKKVMIREITESLIKGQNLTKRANEKSLQTIFDWKGSRTDSITVRDSIKYALTLLHAGLLAMDPETGSIMAWVGGIDFNTQEYDQILARRQTGSVFKPVIYAAALEKGIEPCHYLDNDSIALSDFQDWSPENFDHSYGGKYSLAGALVHSMNVSTFNLFMEVGFGRIDSLWDAMGFSFPLKNTPALALGTGEANLLEIAIAYSSFANGGYKISSQSILSIQSPDGEIIWQNNFSNVKTRVLTEKSALLMKAILRKAVVEGTGSPLQTSYGVSSPFAGKTGTTQNYGDAWFAAFNPKMTIVTRVGASSPLIHFEGGSNGTGSSLALPLVALTIRKIESDPVAREQLIDSLPGLPPDLAGALDCPDFKEDNIIDKVIDLFKKEKSFFNTEDSTGGSKIRSLIRSIFRK